MHDSTPLFTNHVFTPSIVRDSNSAIWMHLKETTYTSLHNYTVLIDCANYQSSFPVGSFILLMQPIHLAAHTHSIVVAGNNKWQLSDKIMKPAKKKKRATYCQTPKIIVSVILQFISHIQHGVWQATKPNDDTVLLLTKQTGNVRII